ncbi:MAG: hypothetical protein QM811_07990 [Pirellulales bacterium]
MLEFFIGVFVILTIVTLIGHGIWVLLAMMFGAVKPRTLTESCCPRCGTSFDNTSHTCAVCEFPGPLPTGQREPAVVRAVARQLARYRRVGLLDAAQLDYWFRQMARTSQEASAQPEQAPPQARPETPAMAVAELASDAPEPQAGFEPPAPIHSHDVPTPMANVPPVVMTWEERQASRVEPPTDENAGDSYDVNSADEVPSEFGNWPARESTLDPVERARRYAEKRRALDQDGPQAVPPTFAPQVAAAVAPRPVPRERFATLLSAFLEEKNIRWGELVGGMLIICCSIALVISFWAQINEKPLLKFSLFNGVTAAVFSLGFYTERRWKIKTTSLGLLLIGVLLTPLNFLAIAAFTDHAPPTDFLPLAGEALSLAVFTTFCFFAMRDLTPKFAPFATLGVMLPCLMQLLTRRFVSPNSAEQTLYLFAGIPLLKLFDRNRRAVRANSARRRPARAARATHVHAAGHRHVRDSIPLGVIGL